MELQQLAGICHEANRALCVALGDTTQERWEKSPAWQRDSVIAGVEAHLADPEMDPVDSHDRWVAYKLADGWVYGDVKDTEAKTHPNMVPFNDLPPEQQAKDHMFAGIIQTLSGFIEPPDAEDDSPEDEPQQG